jgi:hypothetical protein
MVSFSGKIRVLQGLLFFLTRKESTMYFIIGLIVGLILGFILTVIFGREKLSGQVIVNNQDPEEEPYLFLELFESVDTFCKKEYVRFKVNKEKFTSRK